MARSYGSSVIELCEHFKEEVASRGTIQIPSKDRDTRGFQHQTLRMVLSDQQVFGKPVRVLKAPSDLQRHVLASSTRPKRLKALTHAVKNVAHRSHPPRGAVLG